jgi:hypothetical protein
VAFTYAEHRVFAHGIAHNSSGEISFAAPEFAGVSAAPVN